MVARVPSGAGPRWSIAVVVAALLGAGCRGGDRESAATEDPEQIHRVMERLLEAHGGEVGLEKAASYRAEGTAVFVAEREVAEVVRWVDGDGRLRNEFRFPDRGEIRIYAGDSTWIGPDDRNLVARPSPLVDRLARESARRDGPLSLLEREATLSLLVPEKKDALFLFSTTEDSLSVDYRIDPKSHRIQEISLSSEDAPDVVYRVELGAYRWVKGTLFPFKEVHYQGDRRQVEIRFRRVTLSPEIAAPLFPAR